MVGPREEAEMDQTALRNLRERLFTNLFFEKYFCISASSKEVALPKHQVSALFLWDRCQVYPWVTMVKKQ